MAGMTTADDRGATVARAAIAADVRAGGAREGQELTQREARPMKLDTRVRDLKPERSRCCGDVHPVELDELKDGPMTLVKQRHQRADTLPDDSFEL